MSLQRNFLTITTLLVIIPYGTRAQDRFEISVGISTPGLYAWERTGIVVGEDLEYDIYKYKSLANINKESYKSYYYPGFSVQMAYKLPEYGFTKRLSIVGYAGLDVAVFENYNLVSNSFLNKENARKLDFILGVRYHIVSKSRFIMYSQFMVGSFIKDKSLYWEYNTYTDDDKPTVQATLGFRIKTAPESQSCFLTEFGYGSEYITSFILIPGIRLGYGYTF